MIERAAELRDRIDSLARVRDPTGLLSITVGIEPGALTRGTPPWQIALENELTRLSRDGPAGRAVGRWVAAAAASAVPLSGLVDPTLSGKGRALYVALDSGAASDVSLQNALPTRARVGPVAHVLPLLEALDEGEPAGLLAASRDAISVLESELGVVRRVDDVELEPWIGDWWPEMKAAARANPLRGQHVVSHRDRYARRVAAAYRRTLGDAAEGISSLACARGWTRAVIAGDQRRVDVLDEVLRKAGLVTVAVSGTLEGLRSEEAVARLQRASQALVADQAFGWAREANAEAAAGGKGACGLAHVLAALAEGRVARLLIDPSRSFVGTIGPGESLSAATRPGAAVDLTDLIVVRALATGAAVTAVLGDAAKALEARDGIAALLRW